MKCVYLTALLLTFTYKSLAKEFTSGPEAIHLIELYSSEGCSSCPPADRWLASLKKNKGLWKKFVPIEFHVDYWNRLGWIDPFSRNKFTQRQRNYSREWRKQKVYTPEFVLNGVEWKLGEQKVPSKSVNKVGVLKVIKKKNGYSVEFTPTIKSTGRYDVYGAYLGNGLETKVPRGENANKVLRHEFVVLDLQSAVLKKKSNEYQGFIKLEPSKKVSTSSSGVAFWVTKKGELKPIQSVGGYL